MEYARPIEAAAVTPPTAEETTAQSTTPGKSSVNTIAFPPPPHLLPFPAAIPLPSGDPTHSTDWNTWGPDREETADDAVTTAEGVTHGTQSPHCTRGTSRKILVVRGTKINRVNTLWPFDIEDVLGQQKGIHPVAVTAIPIGIPTDKPPSHHLVIKGEEDWTDQTIMPTLLQL